MNDVPQHQGAASTASPSRMPRSEALESLDLKTALEIAGWPASLLAAEKQPTVIEDVKVQSRRTFLHAS